MLKSLEIENFKGIASRQRIVFAPLTLLFGPNSAGKSTILQALVYLCELLERGGADVDRTQLGGDVIELGGFTRLVHRHETDRAIVLRAEFTTAGGLERFGRDLTDFRFRDLDDDVESAWLELTIRDITAPAFAGPLVKRALIGVGEVSDPLIELRTGDALRDGEALVVGVNIAHPLIASELERTDEEGNPLATDVREAIEEWEHISFHRSGLELIDQMAADDPARNVMSSLAGWTTDTGRSWMVFGLSRARFSALPPIGEPLRIVTFNEPEDVTPEVNAAERTHQLDANEAFDKAVKRLAILQQRQHAADQLRTFLEMVIIGTTSQLAESLREALYIGPLRAIPTPGLLYERAGRVAGWANGLAAWDRLLADRGTLIEDTNKWLERVGAGCRVVIHEFLDWTAARESKGYVEERLRRLMLDTGAGAYVLPTEVGTGVSQLVPVVVAALDGRSAFSMIEQPEIHIHPALQVGLGDLFIHAVIEGRRSLLIETHSEHLILRLLRRIRETTDGELPKDVPPFTPEKLSVLYVERDPDGATIRAVPVDPRGEVIDWPHGFFEERAQELF